MSNPTDTNQASEDELRKALFKKLPNGWYYHVDVEGVPQASIHKDAVDSMLNTIQANRKD